MHRTSPTRTIDPLTRGIPSTRASEATRIPQNTRVGRVYRQRPKKNPPTRAFHCTHACLRCVSLRRMHPMLPTHASPTRKRARVDACISVYACLYPCIYTTGNKSPYLLISSNSLLSAIVMNIKCRLLHQATIQLDDVALRKSTKEHGYYIAIT